VRYELGDKLVTSAIDQFHPHRLIPGVYSGEGS